SSAGARRLTSATHRMGALASPTYIWSRAGPPLPAPMMTTFVTHQTIASATGARPVPRSEGGLGVAVELGHVLEARVLRQEHDLDGADRSVPLLPDDDLGDVRLVGRPIPLGC